MATPTSERYSIELTTAARTALKKIKDKQTARRLGEAIEALGSTPRPSGSTALKGATGMLRIRVGDYRIVYTIKDDVLIVVVVTIGHRKDVYRKLKR